LRRRAGLFLLIVVLLAIGYAVASRSTSQTTPTDPAFQEIAKLVGSVRSASFPQLKDSEITVYELHGDYVFLEARFTFSSFFSLHRLRYMLSFNREALTRGVPPDGLRAIVAHELAHIDYFQGENRMGLIGLVRLLSSSFNSRFERNADLQIIALGYGPGLQSYREWLYRNIPASSMEEKKRDYFSPEEIAAILRAERQHPEVMRVFVQCVPLSVIDIEREAQQPAAACRD
jgi:hypothetical protein